MTTSLFNSIHTVIIEHINMYATLISKEHGINKDNLMKLWKQVELNPPNISMETIVTPKKNVSVYVQFCNKHRSILKEKHPNMNFGDISKELGKMWRSLTQQEKDNYQILSKSTTTSKTVTITEPKEEDHSKLSVSKLKQMCEDLNLKKSGNKTILISRLKEYQLQHKPSVNITPPQSNVDDEELVFFENESTKASDISSNSSTSSFVIDDDVDDLDFEDPID